MSVMNMQMNTAMHTPKSDECAGAGQGEGPRDPTGQPGKAPACASCQRSLWRASFGLAALALLGFGLLYCLGAVGLNQLLFPAAANGSLIERNGQVVGSRWVAQPFEGEAYFSPRPSAAGFDAMAMTGSNQARTDAAMRERLQQTRSAIAKREGVSPQEVPGDLFTQSASGIDPHISPQSAGVQIARVARARHMGPTELAQVLALHIEGPQWGILGEPRVNVLELNMALDALAAQKSKMPKTP